MVRAAGAPLAVEHHLPGDNRNLCEIPAPARVFSISRTFSRQCWLRCVPPTFRASKAYCRAVRERGGVAVDVGSALDLWAAAGALP